MNRSRHDFAEQGAAPGSVTGEPIAIVGASCRLPGAPDLDAFWQLLINGIDAVTEIPDDRWNKAALLHPEKGQRGKAYTFAAGTIGDVKGFDASFFGISPREATQMDPQQRLALELAYEATEDAGIDGARLAGKDVGVFVGASSWDYLNLHLDDVAVTDAYTMIGVTVGTIANRVSYALDLHGPSFTVDTACSSSLVALHQACEAMRTGQVPMALVGGVSLLLAPQSYVGFCAASMLSPRGRCHSFDARADGYVRGEGGGFVLLKPLSVAIADGDPIRAVIRATGINSDGRTTGLSLPNRDAQARLLDDVYARFGLDPRDLGYVEAHGTGTPAGDPIECGALGLSLGSGRSQPLPIGSVKTNIGHLEAGSGMAGLLKAMLVAQYGTIPPSLHFETPNPNIPFEDLGLAPVAVRNELAPGSRLIGINSFGFGGTNAHTVLERVQSPAAIVDRASEALPPLLLAARSEEALKALAANWRPKLDDEAGLAALVRGQALRREQHKVRLAIPGGDRHAMISALDAFLEGRPGGYALGKAALGKVAFIFSGNGSQWAGMAADALAGSAGFRTALDEVDALLAPRLGWSVIEALRQADAGGIRNTAVAQPLLFAIQVAIVTALREQGIEAEGCAGHSVGEVAAAWAAGILPLEEAARVICARSSAQQQRHGVGAMAVMNIDAEQAMAAFAEPPFAGSGLSVAAHNSAASVTVAGPEAAIDLLTKEAKAHDWRVTRLDLDYAFHNAIMDPIAPALGADLQGLQPAAGDLAFYSTVAGGAVAGDELDADYWWRNIREPVLFAEAAHAMVDDGFRVFIEIGPHPVLQAYLADALRQSDRDGQVIASLARRPLRGDPIAIVAARAHSAGADMRGAAMFAGPQRIDGLPHYPWQREPFWLRRSDEATDLTAIPFDHPLLGVRTGNDVDEWQRHISLATQPWIADHVVGEAAVMPAAALIDISLAAARACYPNAPALEIADLEIGRALTLEPGVLRSLRTRIDGGEGQFSIASKTRLSDEPWTVHVTGRIIESASGAPRDIEPEPTAIGRIDHDQLYALASELGLDYGPAFRRVEEVVLFSAETATVRFNTGCHFEAGFLLPPDLTDGALQGLLGLAAQSLGREAGVMPWRFGRISLHKPQGATPATARLMVTRVGPRSVRADVALIDRFGAVVAELSDCWFVRVLLGRRVNVADGFYHQAMVPGAAGSAPEITERGHRPANDSPPPPSDAALLIDAFASSAAAEALLAIVPDGVIVPDALIAAGRIARSSRDMLGQLLGWLSEDGLADVADGQWTIAGAEATDPGAILRTLLFDDPRSVAEIALLALASENLPAMLREGPEAAPLLAPALRDQMLASSPAIDRLADAVKALAARWPVERPLRILEVGAQRGEFSRRLARTIDHPGLLLVAATGPDDLPVLADRLVDTPIARVVAWTGEVLADGPFDCVTGLFPMALGGETGDAIARQLTPGGRLLLAEPEPGRLWSLLRPGSADPIDATRRIDSLAAAGFAQITLDPIAGGDWPSILIAARRDAAAAPSDIPACNVTLFGGAIMPGLGVALSAHGAVLSEIDDIDRVTEATGPIVLVLPNDLACLPDSLATIARLAALPARDDPWRVTLLISAAAGSDPVAAAITGARRVLANEAAQIVTRLIRIADDVPKAAEHAVDEILAPDPEQEVSWTKAGRLVPRLRRGLPTAVHGKQPLRLAIERPGLLDTLRWEAMVPATPGHGELGIAIKAAGLNFRDVMWGMGLLPDEALLDGFAGATLGLECAGTVTAVGEGVDGFAVGDRVMAFAPASLSSETITAAHAVMRVPAAIDFASAATVPVAFLTVAYSIGYLARLEAGETILIHGGAGGVGLAAIQYAKHRGAIVYATAGSPAKRALLKSLGVDAVLDSRSLAFAHDIMRLTNGAGVDVVLNSLSGEAMRRSLGLLKPFGRFLELGKRDFYENSAIGLRPFRHNVTYFAIDADQLPLRRPALAARLFGEISELFAAGALRPLPHRTFDYADVEEAFRLMQSSGHIGKIVLTPGHVACHAVAAPVSLTLAQDGAYVVTGGLSGFGLEAARWLASRGARKLALLGRRGVETPGVRDAIATLAIDGVDAQAFAVDVSDRDTLAVTLDAVRDTLGPIRGVIHAAVAMDDALLGALDAGRFARALAPKLGGAAALDELTRRDPVDLFVLFSSVTTPLGNPGQGNYVAANSAIEAIAERRRGEGLPGLAVQWGPIGDAGYLVRTQDVSDLLSRQLGAAHLKAQDALDALPKLIASGLAVAGVAPIRWGALRGRLPLLASPAYSALGGTGGEDAAEVDLRALLASCTPDEARERATTMLVEEVARIMKLAPERIEPQRPLTELGMDSLMAVELRLAVEQRFGVSVPLLALSEGATLAAMAARILRTIGGGEESDSGTSADTLAARIIRFEGKSTPGVDAENDAPMVPGLAAAAAVSP